MTNDDAFEKLKLAFENKTVVKVERANSPESIAKFIMTDKSAFILFATDLGYWIEGTIAHHSMKYTSLDMMIRDCYGYNYVKSLNDIYVSVAGDIVTFTCEDSHTFEGKVSSFSGKEQLVFKSEKGIEILKEAVSLGEGWRIFFSKEYFEECPDELVFKFDGENWI